ncbi:MAG: YopX family protein [Minisyncoccia bacterium]
MREIKFRAWDKKDKLWVAGWSIGQAGVQTETSNKVFMQYTGLQDKNGKEIYELCELNNKYRVLFKSLKYVLQDISNGDIIDMEFNSKLYEITREYSPI